MGNVGVLPEAHLFDERHGRLAEFGESCQRNHGSAKTFSLRQERICFDLDIKRILLIEIREHFLTCLSH